MKTLSEYIDQNTIKGFLAKDEGMALYHQAKEARAIGPCLEIGSYCGLSSVFIGWACRETHNVLYAVDHHRGSEEHQVGEEYHDPELYDSRFHCMDSFPLFRQTIKNADLEDHVIPVVTRSNILAQFWRTPLGFVFIDGGHSHEAAMHDCCQWSEKLALGGILAVHDIFEKPEEGGQGPWLALQKVFSSGKFEKLEQVKSLAFLRKVAEF